MDKIRENGGLEDKENQAKESGKLSRKNPDQFCLKYLSASHMLKQNFNPHKLRPVT
jgi:hypothetical protein